MVYIDTSVLVAYYCPEDMSSQVEDILLNIDKPAISQLTEVELTSALAIKIRERTLTQEDGNEILSQFQTHIGQNSYIHLPIQPRHYSTARDWISQFNTPLRTLDALHLAIAARSNIPILTADIKFANSASILGIEATLVSHS